MQKKTNPSDQSCLWQPGAALDMLRARATLYQIIRRYFEQAGVLEVETPVLSARATVDLHIESFTCPDGENALYLQTSPEFAMKRLLAAGSGDIFQICKSFRRGEVGRKHNPEFTMLEWYRVGFSLKDLMADVEALTKAMFETPWTDFPVYTYRDLFHQHLSLDPLLCDDEALEQAVHKHLTWDGSLSRALSLDLLFSHLIEPTLGQETPCFVTHFPAEQAALSNISHLPDGASVCERFELYYQGAELANGYDELIDPAVQLARFQADQTNRDEPLPFDERLVAAQASGMPECAGVAIGLDRILMLKHNITHIDQALAFSYARA